MTHPATLTQAQAESWIDWGKAYVDTPGHLMTAVGLYVWNNARACYERHETPEDLHTPLHGTITPAPFPPPPPFPWGATLLGLLTLVGTLWSALLLSPLSFVLAFVCFGAFCRILTFHIKNLEYLFKRPYHPED